MKPVWSAPLFSFWWILGTFGTPLPSTPPSPSPSPSFDTNILSLNHVTAREVAKYLSNKDIAHLQSASRGLHFVLDHHFRNPNDAYRYFVHHVLPDGSDFDLHSSSPFPHHIIKRPDLFLKETRYPDFLASRGLVKGLDWYETLGGLNISRFGFSGLMRAIEGNHPITVEWFLKRQVLQPPLLPPPTPYSTDTSPEKPLEVAAKLGHAAIVQLLLHYGAKVHGDPARPYLAPIIMACTHGHLDSVLLLLQNGADSSLQDNQCLRTAAHNNWTEIALALLDFGADPATQDSTPFRIAIENGNLPLIQALLAHGESLDHVKDAALFHAIIKGHLPVISFLILQRPTLMQMVSKFAILHATNAGHWDTVRFLIAKGAPTSEIDGNLLPILKAGQLDLFQYLLQKNQSPQQYFLMPLATYLISQCQLEPLNWVMEKGPSLSSLLLSQTQLFTQCPQAHSIISQFV